MHDGTKARIRKVPAKYVAGENMYIGKLTAALLERVAGVIHFAATDEAADRVDAFGVLTAGIALAFVHVC